MANLSEIKDAMLKGAKQYQIFKDAAEFIGGLEHLEEKETALKCSIEMLKNEQIELNEANLKIPAILSRASIDAQKIVQQGRDEAQKILADASAVIFEQSKSLDQAKNTLTILDDKIKERQEILSAADAAIAQKNDELDRLEKVKADAKTALGL